jgi:hypothetical protein
MSHCPTCGKTSWPDPETGYDGDDYCSAACEEADQPKPQAFPTEGWGDMKYTAYDPNTFDVCQDPDCNCRKNHGGNTRGYGATEAEAIANFWEEWDSQQDN